MTPSSSAYNLSDTFGDGRQPKERNNSRNQILIAKSDTQPRVPPKTNQQKNIRDDDPKN